MPDTHTNSRTVALMASEMCRTNIPGKPWWHIRRFLRAYYPLLQQFELIATSGTAEVVDELMDTDPSIPRLDVKRCGASFEGVVHIAALVAKRELNRVLWFQDPQDLAVDRPENYALLRNCNLAGAHLHLNAAAHLWALHTSELRDLPSERYVREPINKDPVEIGGVQESVILIAHDGEKPRIARFVLHYRDVLRRFPRVLATSGTLKHIEEFLKVQLPPWERRRLQIQPVGKTATMAHGPSGGDVIVADEIIDWYREGGRANGSDHVLHHILFFADSSKSHAHEADIRVLLKACANPRNRVNLILNSRMAEEWANRYFPQTL